MIAYREAMERALRWLEAAEGYSVDSGRTIAEVKVSEGYVTLAREIREAGKGLTDEGVNRLWS
jgi:hypothetical protein